MISFLIALHLRIGYKRPDASLTFSIILIKLSGKELGTLTSFRTKKSPLQSNLKPSATSAQTVKAYPIPHEMPLSQGKKDRLLLILAKKDPEEHLRLRVQEEQILNTRRLIELLSQLPSDRTQIPSLNSKIRNELAIYKNIKNEFGSVYNRLDVWTTQWCDSQKYYVFSEYNRQKRKYKNVMKDYYSCLTYSKEDLESGIVQLQDENERLLEKHEKRV